MNQQEQQGEFLQWLEEAHWLSLDSDKKYLKWLEEQDALFNKEEKTNGQDH